MYNYWCSNRLNHKECDLCNSKGDFQSSKKHNRHAHCIYDETIKLKLMGETTNMHVGEKLKFRPKKEAKERSTNHFKKEILPTLGKTEQRYFKKKFGDKK